MTSKSLSQPRFKQLKTLRAIAIGLTISFAAPAFADNLPEVQRLIKQGQYPQALEKVDAYLSNKPKDAQGRFLKGLIYTEMNKPAEAISVFTKLTEDYPELPEPYNNLAVLYAQQKQYDKARTALEMAIRTHPSYAIAYENLGDVYAKLASQAYDKALQLDNANATTQNKLALIRDLITTSSQQQLRLRLPAKQAPPPQPQPPMSSPRHRAQRPPPLPRSPKQSRQQSLHQRLHQHPHLLQRWPNQTAPVKILPRPLLPGRAPGHARMSSRTFRLTPATSTPRRACRARLGKTSAKSVLPASPARFQ